MQLHFVGMKTILQNKMDGINSVIYLCSMWRCSKKDENSYYLFDVFLFFSLTSLASILIALFNLNHLHQVHTAKHAS